MPLNSTFIIQGQGTKKEGEKAVFPFVNKSTSSSNKAVKMPRTQGKRQLLRDMSLENTNLLTQEELSAPPTKKAFGRSVSHSKELQAY